MSSATTIQGYRISPEQSRLWLLQQQSSAYLAQAAIKIEGPVDIRALEASLAGIVNRLEILRTTFRIQAGMRTPLQVIAAEEPVSLQQIDWSDRRGSQVEAALDELLADQRTRSVNLDTGPVLELCLAKAATQEHYLILSVPSLCADALSLKNLFEEVARAYAADRAEDVSEELQYADFAEWHYQLLDEEEQSPAKTYWREQRLHSSSLTTIHRLRKGEPQGRFEVAIASLQVDRETALAAESLARDKSIPVSDFYLACWHTLVWRLSGQSDIVIGAVADERGHETLRDACGLFAVTLPVRQSFDDRMRFDEVLDAVAKSRRAASDRQYDFSWERDVEGAANNREPGIFPLAFQFQTLPHVRSVGAASFSLIRSFACTDRFHVKLNCIANGDATCLEWHFDSSALSPEEIERLSRSYQAIVKSAVENPRAAALDLEVLDEAQRQAIVVGFNDSKGESSIGGCVHERFEEVARRDPDRTALVHEQQVLSYGALNARANQLARDLMSMGVGPDVPVALCVERSLDMIVGILGILKAGGAYVPLDHALPPQRLATLIEESRAPVVVCQQHLSDLFAESHARLLVLDDASGRVSQGARENCCSGVTPSNLAYALFTSGSTGTPKGVLIEHRQLLNYVDGVCNRLQLPSDASFATVSSFAADLGNTAIFPALLGGGCLHIVSQDRVMDPAAMAEYGERHGVDCLKIVPSHLGALLSSPRPERVLPRRCLVLGGEASSWDLVNRIEALSSDCRVMNHYGPTETTVGVLAYRHERGHLRTDDSDTLPLGRPLSNSQIYLLDSRARPVPIGVNGELHIGGAGVSRGYVNRPDQTAASFVPNPFSSDPGARMYRTGDVARYLSDGNVEFLGRADHQVKIRGFRVELGEIESVLEEHGSVEAAIVMAREDVPGDKRLVGYVVRRGDARVTADELRDYVRERLPEYMVPTAIALLDQLPLNRNGKVDRGALPPITLTPDQGKRPAVLPRTTTEERLMEIWSEVLNNRSLGVHDDFFESGGHSLLAMQLIVRVREAFHVDLPLPALFDTPTVAGLAQSIESLIGAGGTDTASIIKPVSRAQRLPLSFAQQRLWFLDQLEPHSIAYNRSFALRLTGPLNIETLEQSLREVIRRHEVLRTTYPTVNGEAQELIAPHARFTVGLFDLGRVPLGERDDLVRRLVTDEAHRPFDLASGPLVRALLLRLDATDHVLLLSQHHINTDAWSNSVLAHEVSTGFDAFANGLPSPLAELAIQYADYATWQREWLAGETLRRQVSFWKEELKIVPPPLELPADRPRPAEPTFRGATESFRLSKRVSDALNEVSQREGATVFMTVLAAFQTLLHRYTGQPDILIGSPIAGRMRPEVKELIGFFVNTLVLRADLRGEPRFSDVLGQVRHRVLDAFTHQDLPFERLVDELEIERNLAKMPLFQAMLIFQNTPQVTIRLRGLETSALDDRSAPVRSDLDLYAWESEDGIGGTFVYSTDLFDPPTIARLCRRFVTLLESIARDPALPIGDLPLDRHLDLASIPISATTRSRGALSYHQERMWFIDQFETGNVYESHPVYHNLPLVLNFQGAVDADVLQHAINAVIGRHDVLRSRFVTHEGHPYQEFIPRAELELNVRDVTGDAGTDASVIQLALKESQIPTALDRDPVIRATLFRFSAANSVLIVTVHHIAADTASLRLLAEEIAEHYGAHEAGRAPVLPDVHVRYMDYASWQRTLPADAVEQLLFYWRRQLAGPLQALTLPTRIVRPVIHTYSVGRRTFAFSGRLSGQIEALAGAHSTGTFEVLLAAFKVLLRRYSGHDEIVVGTSVPCRQDVVRNVVGPFANLVVLRSNLGDRPTFGTFLKRITRTVGDARRHGDMPFDWLVKELNPHIDMSRTALFDVLFRFDDAPPVTISMGQTPATVVDTNLGHGKYDINLSVQRTADGLSATWVYNTDLFDAFVIEQMAGHLEALLESFTSGSDVAVDDVDVLSAAEQQRQIVDWNSTAAEYPREKTIHGIFGDQVARYPDRVAVVFEHTQLTYRELDERSNRLANYLREQGVREDTLVALCLDRTPDMIVAILAVLKAGGAYLPIDPEYPDERRFYIVDDSGVSHAISKTNCIGALADRVSSLVLLDADRESIASRSSRPPAAHAIPDNVAYCIYTSGSTGKPKGVLLEHRQVVRLMVNDRMPFTFTAEDTWSMFHSYCFDFSVWEMYGALLYGGRLVIVSEGVNKDPQLFLDLVSSEHVTVLNQTPSAFMQLMHQALGERQKHVALRYVVFGGEALAPRQLLPWNQAYPDVKLVNMYGITETTVHVTVIDLDAEDLQKDVSNIGVPIPTLQTYLVDPSLRLLPVGVPGELYVGGAGLARTYLKRPELTAERFIPHPFGGPPGARLYKSGDLARFLPDGEMEYLGRLDHQVKIRGFRIELGEIEAVLVQHRDVREAIVVARADQTESKRLVAYLTADAKSAPTISELRNFLKARLSDYMVPASFVILERFPLTPNGKVDRRALPAPDLSRPELEEAFASPRTPTEQRLADIWCRVLGLERVGVHDSFFDLGGDSILSIQIVSRASQAGLQLSAKQLFENQTIAELALVVGTAPTIQADQGLVTGAAPLTAIQQWFFAQQFADPHHFNQSILLEARTALNAEWLQRAVGVLLAHHDALRLQFVHDESGWHQSSAAAGQSGFSRVDLTGRTPAEQRAALEEKATDVQASLRLDAAPQFRVVLFDLGEQEQRLLLVAHHLVVDGVSWRILLEDLQTAYDQLSRGEVIHLPPKTTSYADWARRCHEYASADGLRGELSYWLSVDRASSGRLPVDERRGANTVASARSVTVTLTAAETEALLREVPDVYHTQINDVLLTAVTEAFTDWTGERSVLIDLEGHGREELFTGTDVSRTVGWFTAMYPVVLEREAGGGPGGALKSIKEQLRKVPRRGIGYGLLRYLHNDSQERLAALPSAQVMFNYLGQVDQALSNSSAFGWAVESQGPTQSSRATRSHLLDVRAIVSDGCLRVSFQYSEHIHRPATVEQLSRGFLAALRSLIAHCQSAEAGGFTPSDFELSRLTQAEIDRHFANDRSVEDVYPLSPLQEGMLFHCLRAPNSGAYVTHLALRISGALDVEAFKRAWDRLVNRHTALRTGFLWDKVSESVQVVRRHATVSWNDEDWRGIAPEKQSKDLRAFLNRDRIQGFDLSKAPLIRLALIRLAEDAYYFVWTHHHMVIDGWSAPLILQEVLALYKVALRGAEATERARPYRDYIAWLKRQDLARAESYWRKRLAGLDAPTSMGASRHSEKHAGEIGNAEYRSRLPAASTRSLRAFAREHDLTVNTVAQGAWAVLLSACSGDEDVVYGAALSGRPPSLLDVARIPGMFINTLPVRVTIDPDVPVREWLRQLQDQLVELREYEYSPLAQVHGWSQVPRSVPLFDVVVTFQNFPVDKTLIEEAARNGLEIDVVLSQEQSTAPLTVFLTLDEEFAVRFAYDPSRFDEHTIAGLAERYLRILTSMVSNGQASMMDLQIDNDSEVPKLPTMAIVPPSAEELQLLDSLDSWIDDTETDAPDRKD